jgi:hypothetical protein
MGEAKRRGTYEQRKAEAIAKNGGVERKPKPRKRASRQALMAISMMHAMGAWTPPPPDRFS